MRFFDRIKSTGLFDRIRNIGKKRSYTKVEFITQKENGYFSWGGNLYHSDIVRACIRPKVKAIGKLVAKHVRETVTRNGTCKIETNPDVYMKFLLEEPNPMMSGQKLQEKLATQLCLNGNAFALIVRDQNGLPMELYPIDCQSAEAFTGANGHLYVKFTMCRTSQVYTFSYSDLIHLRADIYDNKVFGTSIAPALCDLMEVVSKTDQSILHAITNSAVIRWLMMFKQTLRPEKQIEHTERFAKQFLSAENGTGVAGVDSTAEMKQVTPNDYVPNAAIMKQTLERLYNMFNTNSNIVQSSFTEDEWNSYYEAEVEPVAVDLQNEYTRKLFSRRERSFGNRIVFEAANLQCSSVNTRLAFVQMVDRGSMSPNEWRKLFNWAPIEGGDKPIRRLDTAQVTEDND